MNAIRHLGRENTALHLGILGLLALASVLSKLFVRLLVDAPAFSPRAAACDAAVLRQRKRLIRRRFTRARW